MPGGVANLTPFNTLTPERRREISVMGGKARAEQRRQQRREIDRIKAEQIAARELDLVLTSRSFGKETRSPMAGIPYHAVENYLSRIYGKTGCRGHEELIKKFG